MSENDHSPTNGNDDSGTDYEPIIAVGSISTDDLRTVWDITGKISHYVPGDEEPPYPLVLLHRDIEDELERRGEITTPGSD